MVLVVRNSPANAGDTVSVPGLGISLGGNGNTLQFLPGKSHGQRSLVGYRGHKEPDRTERLTLGRNDNDFIRFRW